jgi:hypothetical protein
MFINSASLFFTLGHLTESLFGEALTKPTGDIPFDTHLLGSERECEQRFD